MGWGVGGGGAERHDSASGSCIELDLRNCIEIDQIGRIESDKINLFVYFEEPQSLESLRPHSDCLPCLTPDHVDDFLESIGE